MELWRLRRCPCPGTSKAKRISMRNKRRACRFLGALWYYGLLSWNRNLPENTSAFCNFPIMMILFYERKSHYCTDSAYAERYMGLPNVTSNYKGYAESNVYDKVDYLHDKMFYLVHGTADDNVQFQQSMALARHLAKKGILFRQQVFR